MINRRILVIVAGLALGVGLATADVHAQETTSFDFLNHIQLEMPEQDVFVESADDAEMVVRVEGEDANAPDYRAMDAYGTAEMVEHDPFKLGENPLGPFQKGAALGFTLGEWLDGTGSGTYVVDGDQATLELSLSGLAPDGVYTVWCSRMTMPPNPKVEDYPCGAADGSENTLTTDSSGDGSIQIEMSPLAESTAETSSVVALAYHSDGETYGADPGSFGEATHVQLVWLVPAPEQEQAPEEAKDEQAEPEALPKTGAGDSSWLMVVLGLLLIAVGAVIRRQRVTDSATL